MAGGSDGGVGHRGLQSRIFNLTEQGRGIENRCEVSWAPLRPKESEQRLGSAVHQMLPRAMPDFWASLSFKEGRSPFRSEPASIRLARWPSVLLDWARRPLSTSLDIRVMSSVLYRFIWLSGSGLVKRNFRKVG